MAYVAVKGGERAIDAAHAWLAEERRGDPAVPELGTAQIAEQLGRAVDRVMAEGACYDPGLAALAIKQAQGDLIEAAFLLRAYRTTLPRFAHSRPVATGRWRYAAVSPPCSRTCQVGRCSAPPTTTPTGFWTSPWTSPGPPSPKQDRLPPGGDARRHGPARAGRPHGTRRRRPGRPGDLTREPLAFPAGRDLRLQALARGDEGFLLALVIPASAATAAHHPFVGELRVGEVAIELDVPELGFPLDIGTVTVTECQMVNQFQGTRQTPPQFTRGYGLCFGHNERKAMAMALVDRSMRAAELGEDATAPGQDVEFVLSHCDNIEATGFVEHLKLPHYVDFQSELETIRRLRTEAGA